MEKIIQKLTILPLGFDSYTYIGFIWESKTRFFSAKLNRREYVEISNKILSDITVHMKYARYIPELQRRETWEELVTRNKIMHQTKYPNLTEEIENAYKLVYDKKVLPSMRSLQFAGKSIEISPNRIYNCAYLPIDDWRAFGEIMFLLLGGTGVGYSVQRHHVEKLPPIHKPKKDRERRFLIGDSIEGWADSVKALIKSYFNGSSSIRFDYSDIRPKGSRLITSGGKAPGPEPLRIALEKIRSLLDQKNDGEQLRPIEVHDVICHIADAVLAGGIRRAALISLFSANDDEMVSSKFGSWWELNPQRGRANNSAVLLRSKVTEEFFKELWKKIELSNAGEPGIYLSHDKDWGTNPCVTGDTLVAVADGRNAVSIKQLAEENYTGPVYSIQTQTGQVVTSYCSRVWKTRENAELVKVTLDDGSEFRCTPDHLIMLRNGNYIPAKDLEEGVSLMPFNSKQRTDGRSYRMIQSNTGRDIAQYAHVAQYYDIVKVGYDKQHIHHIDGDGTNDLPSNLEAINASEHNRMHMLGKQNAYHKMSESQLRSWKDKQSKRQSGAGNTNSNGITSEELYSMCFNMTLKMGRPLKRKEILDTCGVKFLSKGRLNDMGVNSVGELSQRLYSTINHKVTSVEYLTQTEDVYDMTVEGTHNFGIITSTQDDKAINSSGVFIHNCCEIALRPFQFCNLCEVNVSDVESQEDLDERVKAAAFIGTLQAGYTDFHYLRPVWQRTTEKDALLGIGMTGIGSGKIMKLDVKSTAAIAKKENERVAGLLGIKKAARVTTVKPAGTSSLTLGCSSGIHAWHNDFYLRRVRVGKNEAIYKHLVDNHPELVEDEYFRPHDTAVISVPQKAPEGSILRTESPLELLERVKWFSQNWIKPGHRNGMNTHNISATVSIREHEWDSVGKWMWENREYFNGLSVLPFDGGNYTQAPFEDITEEKYNDLVGVLHDIDLSEVIEHDDETDLSGEIACGGGSCEIV